MHGYGLNARVTGDLSLRDLSNKQIVANGELKVLQGNYGNHKQKIAISGGRLKFRNHDFDNPELDLDIKKKSAYVMGSYKIVGRLQKLFNDANLKARNHKFKTTSDKVALNQAQ
jgi:autotransporter translocation and assembly factor TamB